MVRYIHGEGHGRYGEDSIYHFLELQLQRKARRTSFQTSNVQEIFSGGLYNVNSAYNYTADYSIHESEEMYWRSLPPPFIFHPMFFANSEWTDLKSEHGVLYPLDYAASQLATTKSREPYVIKIPISSAFCGAIIGKKGSNAKLICQRTGLWNLTVQDQIFSGDFKYLAMGGSVDALCLAVEFVRHLIIRECLSGRPLDERYRHEKYKTKLCTKYLSGFCPYSNFCQFAHGTEEVRIQRTKSHH
ncbi:protein MpC3H38 [Marchantia polymorpha subsp. ruderalis]|uniref:C3H1-type domain-containing protein n=1 Tax=Marchantia polymorpha TaxID=3197 RepID=A0A2R6XM83_MARPO|nr:hypothetical protein MARPO_0008s0006 [Marchantia polymorpha]BBN19613.1 hypothetical protein Mp_8g12100 [Marchantia polymorpha subsp. ruderalis]|eukprot:PTQ47212.1 hypothetical protein MARPO_0008s0006 [Marchantia polymorpha]